jgi:hypothetical protein
MANRADTAAFDVTRPHVARVYDYLLGGKDNFAADRAVGDRMLESLPAVQLGFGPSATCSAGWCATWSPTLA